MREDYNPICTCGCGCEPDGDWHFNEPRCACRMLNCPCVTDIPSPLDRKEFDYE